MKMISMTRTTRASTALRRRRIFAPSSLSSSCSFSKSMLLLVLLAFSTTNTSITDAVLADESSSSKNAAQTCPSSMPSGACRASLSSSSSSSSSPQKQQQQLECSVYMAPSTLEEAGGNMGIYTGITLQEGDVLNYPEIAIPLLFREWGQHPPGYDDGKIFDNYIWEGSVMDIESYEDTNREASRAVFVPGIGCTVNSLLDMHNVYSTHGSTFDMCDLHRSRDAGVGAFSPYHAAQTKASRNNIVAGSELFGKYGDYWIPTIPGVQVTFDPALDAAEDFLRLDYIPFVLQNYDKMTLEMKEALWDFTENISSGTRTMKSQAMSNLPRQSWSLVEEYFLKQQQQQQKQHQQQQHSNNNNDIDNNDNTIDYKKNEDASIVRHFIRQQTIRSMDWLNSHGYCQDHLRPGRSTIRQAGRGAFASRDLPKGTIVGFAPVIHTGEQGRVLFDITYTDVGGTGGGDSTYDQEQQQQQQERHAYDLILNYSFGHANSTILLTPYGGMVNYINHAQPASTANVRIQWPDHELVSHKPDWLQKDVTFLRHVRKKIGLSLEYVALRDIKQGEEVFMDYGDAWEKAWLQHVQQWEPVEDAHLYVHSTQFTGGQNGNDARHYPPTIDGNGVLYFLTTTELESNPYPPNLHTMCLESFTTTTTMPATTDPQQQQEQEQQAESFYVWINPMLNTHHRAFCHVVARRVKELSNGGYEYEYDVDLFWQFTDTQTKKSSATTTTSERWIRVYNVPFDGIGIYDKAFSTDWHLHNAFRHEIMIPDDMMPKSWQNGPPPPLQQQQQQ